MVDNIKLFTEVNRQIFEEVLVKLKSGEKLSINDMNIDRQILDKIDKFAPIKNLLKNKSKNDYEVVELFEDISRDLMNYDLEHRIKELESKFSKGSWVRVTFNELKELKKKAKYQLID